MERPDDNFCNFYTFKICHNITLLSLFIFLGFNPDSIESAMPDRTVTSGLTGGSYSLEIVISYVIFVENQSLWHQHNTIVFWCSFCCLYQTVIRHYLNLTNLRDVDLIADFYSISSCQVSGQVAAHSALYAAVPQTPLLDHVCFTVILDRHWGCKTGDRYIILGQTLVLCCLTLSRKSSRVITDDQIDIAVCLKNGCSDGNSLLCILLRIVVIWSNILPVREVSLI